MNTQSTQSAEMLGSDAGLLPDPAELSTTTYSQYTHNTVPTRFVQVGGSRFAYRRFGNPIGTPIVLLQHFMGNLDNYDPVITDALSVGREVILNRQRRRRTQHRSGARDGRWNGSGRRRTPS